MGQCVTHETARSHLTIPMIILMHSMCAYIPLATSTHFGQFGLPVCPAFPFHALYREEIQGFLKEWGTTLSAL